MKLPLAAMFASLALTVNPWFAIAAVGLVAVSVVESVFASQDDNDDSDE